MGSKKQATVQRSIRLPEDLYKAVQQEADQYHGGDFTAALIFLVSKAREYSEREKRLIAEGWECHKGEERAPQTKRGVK
jgi:hypothetical protein